jgi:RpiR family carbohydrate utilization transcriptional regulator
MRDNRRNHEDAPLDSPLARLGAALLHLPPTARRIADQIIADPDRVITMSIGELAEAAQASEGSVIGLCREIGASGFQELKIALAKDIAAGRSLIHEDVVPTDGTGDIVRKIAASHATAVTDTIEVLDVTAIDAAVRLMAEAERVEFYGVGTAAPVAEDAAYRFLRLGLVTKGVTDSHMQAVSAAFTGPKVATVTISHSGRTKETLAATRIAREAGARTIGVTNYGRSPLQQHCEVVLFTAAKETRYRMEALSSRIAQLTVIDILYARLAAERWEDALDAIARSHDILSAKRLPNG